MLHVVRAAGLAVTIAFASQMAVPAHAQTPADFYKSHTVTLSVGSDAGSGFDLYARTLARHLSRHIPGNPTVVVRNLPGAGGLRHMGYFVTAAPKDGSEIGLLNPATTVTPMLGSNPKAANPDSLEWLGSANSETVTCLFWPHAKINDVSDLTKRELVIGGSGSTAPPTIGALTLRTFLNFPWKVVVGYKGSPDLMLAGERGEIDGTCILLMSTLKSNFWSQFQNGAFKVMLQMSPSDHPDLPGVKNAFSIVESDEQRQALDFIYGYWAYGRPFAVPGGVPADRVQALRTAFKAALEDPEFIAEATKRDLTVDYMSPEEVTKRFKVIRNTPAAVVEKVRALIPK